MDITQEFESQLKEFVSTIQENLTTEDGQWSVKGFVDVLQNVYTISSDTKIISKVLEIHLFPYILEFAQKYDYKVVLAEYQNHYPDVSFVKSDDNSIRFALDFKTTYRDPKKPHLCNGFTLGSFGAYFQDRASTKNIRFPYGTYTAHFCLGIIYDRADNSSIEETKVHTIDDLRSIPSVISNFEFFAVEKWKIASDKKGSGNTANIGSIKRIDDLKNGKGTFSRLGEAYFDDYWMNFGKIRISNGSKGTKLITNLEDFVNYRSGDASLIVAQNNSANDADDGQS